MIKTDKLCLGYGEKIIVKDFSYTFDTGLYYLNGISGSGKSTLLKGLAGVMMPIQGTISRTGKMTMVFQENRLLSTLSVRKNIKLVADTDIEKVLDMVELTDFADTPVYKLSGGQKRRVAIARALCYGGDTILLDEPFEGLDMALRIKTGNYIKEHFDTIIIATHEKSDIEILGNATVVNVSRA